MRAANGLARILKAEGVEWVSTFPTCGVNNALGEEGLCLLMMRDERYAVAVADAFSRLTEGRKVGACTVMGGVNAAGLQMAYGAIAQAYEDSSPVLCITDGVPASANGNSHYDIGLGFRAVTKWIGRIEQPEQVPEVMRRAFTYLRAGRTGPILVTIPRDVCRQEYSEDAHPYRPVKGWRSAPDPDDVRAAVTALLAAQRPLLYVGEGVFYGQATDEVRRFAELVQAPVLTTLKAKSAFPEDHPLSVGVRGELAEHFLHNCDLLFAIGSSLSPNRFSHSIPNAKRKVIVQCTKDELDINKNYPVAHAVIGDSGLALSALIEEASRQTAGGRHTKHVLLDEIAVRRAQFRDRYRPLLESPDKPINPYRVYGDLTKTIDRNNSFVTHDSGNTRDQLSTVYEALIPHGFMGWGNVSSLGFGLAAAVAAKLAFPERQCVNVTGDAGVGYMMGNLEALVRNKIGITTIHINNGGFAGYGPGFWGPGHDPYTCDVSDHTVHDMSKAAEAIGCYAEDVVEPEHIIPALRRAFAENACGRPAYLEVLCSQYPVFGQWITDPRLGH